MSGDDNRDRYACWGGLWPGMGAEMSTHAGTGTSASAGYLYGVPPILAPRESRSGAAFGGTRPPAASASAPASAPAHPDRPIKREAHFPPSPTPDSARPPCRICLDADLQCPLSNCRCPHCVRGEPDRCIEAAMAFHQTETRDALHREHAFIRTSLHRIELLVAEDQRFLQRHERHLWQLERDNKDSEIRLLKAHIDALGNENRLLRRHDSLQNQHSQPPPAVPHPNLPVHEPPPVVYTGFSDALPVLNSGVPRFLAQPAGRSTSEAGILNRTPSLCDEYAGITPTSPEIVFDVFGVPGFARDATRANSPEWSPPSPTLMMRRSPKRSASAVDDGEAQLGMDGVAPRTSVAQSYIFTPASPQGASSPRIKRQRSMSHDYFLVTDVNAEPEADEGELQRLTMHAGHTPNRSLSSPSATATAAAIAAVTAAATAASTAAAAAAGPSGGGITPTAAPYLGFGINPSMRANANANEHTKTEFKPEVKPEMKSEIKPEMKSEIKPEMKSEVKSEMKSEVKSEMKSEVKSEMKSEVKPAVKPEVKGEIKPEAKAKAEETGTAEIDSFYENVMRNSPPLSQRNRRMTIPDVTEGLQSQMDEANRRQSRLNVASYSPPTNPGSSIIGSPASQRALLDAMDDNPLAGPLMIRNIPAQDEVFLQALNGRLGPISQGQDALPRVVQDLDMSAVPDDAERLEAQSDSGEDEDAPVKIERPIRREDSDSDSEPGPEVTLKLRHTSNFGAPFGRM
ncbi:hypothetical protein TRIATDRAFT_86167 [Trichoderma atroviride IMI 206040]|uniref:Uncharacterized protein n=1 Tax=Hypocrea atroviridis (strain ATCC 20476 / IMI 206040) TaxID=452589 RepID=G9P3M4_HYPAI|nr:uncharacterized protein TRIATDRAFT_86167 [Trichoderma atroviride IMI 206040]EHK42982.1 hypothetical protein TRIATDRAFT_86167 [Trichoderma atroviride IMI 206040]